MNGRFEGKQTTEDVGGLDGGLLVRVLPAIDHAPASSRGTECLLASYCDIIFVNHPSGKVRNNKQAVDGSGGSFHA